MKRTLLAALIPLGSPAVGQTSSQGVDWSKPVVGVDMATPPAAGVGETYVILSTPYRDSVMPIVVEAVPAMIEQGRISLNADTPLPPPCEAPLPRSPAGPPGPTAPAPPPCRP